MLRFIGNILWLIFGGGFVSAIIWWFFGVLAFISIIGIPWGRACFVMGQFALWPFGRTTIGREHLSGLHDIGTSIFGSVGNIIWLLLAGIWIAFAHFSACVAYCLTIIGIPFGIQHFKLGMSALMPIGDQVVHVDRLTAPTER